MTTFDDCQKVKQNLKGFHGCSDGKSKKMKVDEDKLYFGDADLKVLIEQPSRQLNDGSATQEANES